MQSARIRRYIPNTLVALASVLITCLAVEGLFRMTGSPLRAVDGVVLWGDPRASRWEIWRAAHDHAAFTIVGLGDSIMYGQNKEAGRTYLDHVQRVLGGRLKRTVRTLNLAVPGYNTVQEYAMYRERVEDRIRPDLLIVHFWENDIEQYGSDGSYVYDTVSHSDDQPMRPGGSVFLPVWLNDVLLMHSVVYDRMFPQIVPAQPHQERTRGEWAPVCDALRDLSSRAHRSGGRLLVLSSPRLDGVTPAPIGLLPLIRQCASANGFEAIDLSEWLQGISAREIALDDCHFNDKGHTLIGERLVAYLLEHDLKEEAALQQAPTVEGEGK